MFVIVTTTLMLIVSLCGVTINSFLFWKFLNKETNGFLRYCLAKTIPNVIVCLSFLFWAAPLTAFSINYEQIPRPMNVLVGQISGFGAYVAGSIIELFMAVNRWSVIYFPTYDFRYTNYALLFTLLCACFYAIIGLIPTACGFVYDPDAYLWRPERTECADHMEDIILYTIYAVSAVSNSLNFATFVKLCYGRVTGISDDERSRRRKRRVRLFVQSVIQNCLHVIDMINFNFIAPLSSSSWFQFTFNSMSFLSIHALDGIVMFLFHPEVQPRRNKSSSILVIAPQTG